MRSWDIKKPCGGQGFLLHIRESAETVRVLSDFVEGSKFLEGGEALLADALALVGGEGLGRAAEYARFLVFCEDDAVALCMDLKRVAYVDAEGATDLDGEYEAAELVDLSDNACGFHGFSSWIDKIWL